MQPIHHILVPIDFGEPAQVATEYAVDLATRFEAELTLVHVYEPPMYPYAIEIPLPLEDLYREAKKATHDAAERVRASWPRAQAVIAEGAPLEQILRIAQERKVDLIVTGTHGRRGVSRALLGSVAERIVRMSPVPVLTVHGRTKSTAG